MRIRTDSNYDGGNVTQLKIRLNATGEAMRMNIVKPNVPDYTIGELSRPNDVELIFDDSRDLDTFIDALLQLQKYHRESVGEWSGESCGARAKPMTGFDGYDSSGIFADALSVWNSRASKKLRVKEMDIVNYVEQVCNFPLSDLQKEFVREAYDSIKNGKKLFYLPTRGQSRFSFEILYAIATIIVGVENNLVKGDAINVN